MKPATQKQADSFVAYMANAFHLIVIRKDQNSFAAALAFGFDIAARLGIKVPTGDQFIKRTSTTIGNVVFMASELSPDEQMEVIVHEAQHAHQFFNGSLGLPGAAGMFWLYLIEPEARVRYEVQAYRAGLEFTFKRTGQLPTLESFGELLHGSYALKPEMVQFGQDLLESAATSVANRQIDTVAGLAAVTWLNAHAAGLVK